LIDLFAGYLTQQHGPQQSEHQEDNARVLQEWGYFRQLLTQHPRKFDAIYSYFY
jgi:hypothetical protein